MEPQLTIVQKIYNKEQLINQTKLEITKLEQHMKLEEKNWQNNFNKMEHEINQATFALREQRIKHKEKE